MYAAARGKMAGEQAHNVQVKPSVEEWGGVGGGWGREVRCTRGLAYTRTHAAFSVSHVHRGHRLLDRGRNQRLNQLIPMTLNML